MECDCLPLESVQDGNSAPCCKALRMATGPGRPRLASLVDKEGEVQQVARSDLLVDLVEAEQSGDRQRFRRLVEAIIAEERAKSHHLVADRLTDVIATSGTSARERDAHAGRVADLLHEVVPTRKLHEVHLDDAAGAIVRDVVQEHHRADLLRSHNLEPRHRLLFEGPSGNGKTTLAEAIATEVMLPFYVIRYEGIISSFLGESASRLDDVFNFARTRRCVLFFDEFDTIGKERADEHETGEVKRVVSTLLLQIDRLPAHVIVIAATNHAEILDRAAWRRFQVRLTLDRPNRPQKAAYLEDLQTRLGGSLGLAPRTIADKLASASFSDLEQLALDIRRQYVLQLPDADLRAIARTQLDNWRAKSGS